MERVPSVSEATAALASAMGAASETWPAAAAEVEPASRLFLRAVISRPSLLWAWVWCGAQSQKAVAAYFTSRQLLPFSLAEKYPSKHETLTQRWFNVGPPSATLAQH